MSEKTLLTNNLEDFIQVQSKDISDIVFVSKEGSRQEIEDSSQLQDLISFNVSNSVNQEEVFELDFNVVINSVVRSMNKTASVPYKQTKFLEPCEIEEIRQSLSGNDIIAKELESFQEQINLNYTQRVKTLNEEKMQCIQQMEMFEDAKQKIVMKRASQMLWPLNEETKEYDRKINAMKFQIERYSQKIELVTSMRPAATEKDILIFQTQLKQKFNL